VRATRTSSRCTCSSRLLDQSDSSVGPLLQAVGADVASVRASARSLAERLPSASGSTVAAPQLARATYQVLERAGDVARDLDDEYVSTEHLLVALAQKGEGGVSSLLAAWVPVPTPCSRPSPPSAARRG
jgi:ATP-dependent Clp protease ATP-binding subunit ClpB